MTVSSAVAAVLVNGGAGNTVFSFSPMVINAASELRVYRIAADGTERRVREGSGPANYSLTVSSYPGTGSIKYPAAGSDLLPGDEKLRMERQTPLTQGTDFENQGQFFAETVEKEMDKSRRIDAELKRDIDANADAIKGLPGIVRANGAQGSAVSYDPKNSGMRAVNAQDAIDELHSEVDFLDRNRVPITRKIDTTGPLTGGRNFGANITLGMDTLSGVAGSYTNPSITVDTYGRVLAVSSSNVDSQTGAVNVKDYGAKGDDTSDDTGAFRTAIADLPATNGTLIIPPGSYRIASRLTIKKGDINIFGFGAAATKLKWVGTGGGIDLDLRRAGSQFLEYGHRFSVRGITFETNQRTSAGTGLRLRGSHALGKVDVANTLDDLSFVGSDDNSSWDVGIDCDEVSQVSMSKLKIDGNKSGIGAGTQKGLRIYSKVNSNNFFIDSCMFTWCQRAISVEMDDAAGYGPEGVQVVNCNMVAVDYGIHALEFPTSGRNSTVGLVAIGNHIAATNSCITGYLTQATIRGNLLYDTARSSRTSSGVHIPADAQHSGHTQIMIQGNIFINAHGTGIQGVILGSSSGGGAMSFGMVWDNFFSLASGSSAITMYGNTSRCFTRGNVVTGGAQAIANSGSRQSIGNRAHLGYLSGDVSISSNSDYAVPWGATGANPERLITVGSPDITIPGGAGIQRIIIRACVTFSGNTSGHRGLVIVQDSGSGYTGNWIGAAGNGANPGDTNNNIRLFCQTPTINVADGYKFRVIAQQTSGSTLSLRANRTWVEVEVVE